MRIITLSKASPGMKLAKAVFTKDGRIVLPAGDVLSSDSILKIEENGISAIFIQEEKAETVVSPEIVQKEATKASGYVDISAFSNTAPPSVAEDSKVLAVPSGAGKATSLSYSAAEEKKTNHKVDAGSFVNDDIPQDIMNAAREAVELRFKLCSLEHPLSRAVVKAAVERQARIFLASPHLIPAATQRNIPAFQTKKPEPSSLKVIMASSHKLGTLPLVFHKLIEIVNDPNASALDTAQVLSTDPALCAKLLKLVNSPYYGLAVRIDTIPRAVTLVGTGQIVMLAMGSTLMTAFKGVPVSLINMQTFWNHSLACGIGASLLGSRIHPNVGESFFVAGLLHDIGKLIIYSQLPNHAMYMMLEARREQLHVHSLEKSTLGFTHEELSAAILEEWRCPPKLVSTILAHHKTIKEDATVDDVILPFGNFLAQGLGYGSSGEVFLPQLPVKAWELLQLSPEKMLALCAEMDAKVRDMRAIFMTG